LNQAKRKGRNTWQWYRGGGAKSTRDSVLLRNELQKALETNQFTVYYQPLVDAVSGKIRSVEALVRWNHPERGMVSPGDFIPLAESTGQIIPLGQWVLKHACQEIARLNENSERMLPVAVNISSLQFLREDFLANVDKALEESGLPPQFLELEVTESVLLDGAEPVIALMQSLNKRGINVAIDDFGTGFSSLSYLRDLPTHKVKLDRSFINKTLTDRRTAAIVQGVITMAHHMDMVVVAEGIETLEEQNDLVRRNCDLLQGYRFSKPVPLEVLEGLPDRLPVK
ncbi:MAG: two-component response regulator, partial [Marinobacter sp. T13-3]